MLCASCAIVEASAPRPQPEPAHEPEADPARAEVALDHGDLREVALRIGDDLAVDDRRLLHAAPRSRSGRGRCRSRARRRRSTGARSRRAATCWTRTVCLTQSGTSGRWISPTGRPRLSTSSGTKRSRSGRSEQVGLVAGRDRAEVRQPVPDRGLCEAMTSASSGGMPSATASRTIELTWPSSAMCSGSRSSVQNAIRVGPNSRDERHQRHAGCARRRLADQQPHAGAQPLPALLDRVRLVVGADPGRGVGVEGIAEHAGRVAVDVLAPRARASRAPLGSPEMTPGKFIISASPITRRRRSSPRGRRARAGGGATRSRTPARTTTP